MAAWRCLRKCNDRLRGCLAASGRSKAISDDSGNKPSKSARKRAHLAHQALGESLIGLSEPDLAALPLDADLAEAIRKAAGMRAHGALRRQRQLIGKLIARADVDAIRRAFDAQQRPERENKRLFRESERWRDRLLKNGAGELAALAADTGIDPAPFRALLTRCQSAQSDADRRQQARQLFRELHTALLRARD